MSEIHYGTFDLGGGRWQYSYDVQNIGINDGIEEFTIYFDYGLYANLTLSTNPLIVAEWDEILIDTEPIIGDDGFYDALALRPPIGIDEVVSGFSITFDWLGIGTPGSQYYEIINAVTFETIESGYTVPEPATCLLLFSGGVLLRRRKRF